MDDFGEVEWDGLGGGTKSGGEGEGEAVCEVELLDVAAVL